MKASARLTVCMGCLFCLMFLCGLAALGTFLVTLVSGDTSTTPATPVTPAAPTASSGSSDSTVVIVAVALGVGVFLCCGCCCFCFCPSKPGSAERALQAQFDMAFPVGSDARSGVVAIAEFVERTSMRVLSRVSVRSSFAGRLSTTRVSRYSQGVRVRPGMDSFAETSCAQTSMAAASARDSSLESARDSSVAPALNAPRVDFRSVATR